MRTLTTLCLLALPIALSAQDGEPQALTVKTSSTQVAEDLLDMFDSESDLPELAAGSFLSLSLDDGGGLIVKAIEGKVNFIELEARPILLMDLFEEQVDGGRQMAQMFGGMGLGQVGIAAQDINTIINGLFDFPKQINLLKITVPNDPEGGTSIDASIEVHAVDGSWLGQFLAAMQPNQNGVRLLDSTDAMISVIGNIHFPSIDKYLAPFNELAAGMGMDTDEERKESLAFINEMNSAYDGTFNMVVDAEAHSRSIAGLTDGSLIGKLWNNKRFVELQKLRSETNDMIEVSLTPKAHKYQEVDIHKLVLEFDNPDMAGPFGEDGKQTTFMAAAGSYMLSANSKSDTEALIDQALDGEAKRKKVSSLLSIQVDVDALLDMLMDLAQGQMPQVGEGAPSSLKIDVNKKGKALVIGVHTK